MKLFIDKRIKTHWQALLHAKHDEHLRKALARFSKDYPGATEEDKARLETALTNELKRIYDIVDASILKATIIQARYTLWFSLLFAIPIIWSLSYYLQGNFFAFVSPLIMAFCSWFIRCITVDIPYDLRIKGAMASTTNSYARNNHLIHRDKLKQEEAVSVLATLLNSEIKTAANEQDHLVIEMGELDESCTNDRGNSQDKSEGYALDEHLGLSCFTR